MRSIYLALAIIGTIIPLAFFAQFFLGDELSTTLPGFVPALFINGATAGFTVDLLISSFVFWVFIWDRRARGPKMLPFIVLNLLVGLSCALPAYLYASVRKEAADE